MNRHAQSMPYSLQVARRIQNRLFRTAAGACDDACVQHERPSIPQCRSVNPDVQWLVMNLISLQYMFQCRRLALPAFLLQSTSGRGL